jgi:uridine kinase
MQIQVGAEDIFSLASHAREGAAGIGRPYVVAIDGRSGVGKSTLALRLVEALDACLLDGDAFFRGGVVLRRDTPRERADDCIDWRLQRPVLEALRAGRASSYFAFDWDVFDGRLEARPTHLDPRSFIVFEGVYSARPELADLVDLRVLVRARDDTRTARLLAREGTTGPWQRQWHEAEEWYFTQVSRPQAFDVVVDGDDAAGS